MVYDQWREANRRPLWLPQTQEGQFANQPNRFGGAPDLAPDETWPRCRHCGVTMPLFLQLDVATLPAKAPVRTEVGQGLVQLFGCADCGAPLSEDGSAVARLLPAAARQTALMSHQTKMLPPQSIVGWQRHEQLPTADEWEGDELPDEEEEQPQPWIDQHGFGHDQLGGWPSWVQYAEYPPCPVCGRPQRLLFQIASEQGLDFMFCDVGTAYLLYCSHHADQLSFSWQST
ncbi:DUF1963 domain-containing protein [Hymenobacter gummosus]|uniref:DUF1963 domain-containing protein n=1 Tax=Hymenobacter gummosus TaxID=1776032 RepID=UPI0014053ECF|nr:DUF1963 domain-containing protein [Hymenobacter gummosus]